MREGRAGYDEKRKGRESHRRRGLGRRASKERGCEGEIGRGEIGRVEGREERGEWRGERGEGTPNTLSACPAQEGMRNRGRGGAEGRRNEEGGQDQPMVTQPLSGGEEKRVRAEAGASLLVADSWWRTPLRPSSSAPAPPPPPTAFLGAVAASGSVSGGSGGEAWPPQCWRRRRRIRSRSFY